MPTTAPALEDFTTVAETAQRLGIGARRLRDGVNHGGFPAHRMGRRLMFSPKDRAQIAEMHRIPAKPTKRLSARAA
ncbi:helix-turn-helix domain-containing protein [Streptomyces sp. NPDC051320]|uniref:helix-turn-helix domain-containing protein n=1 Tax=Streptomyces sp. NPDC051320 TaxID=3154644 RepID=UPI003423B6D1